jgi:hypothetical protein
MVGAKRTLEVSPKLELSKKLLVKADAPEPQSNATITFIDGSSTHLDLTAQNMEAILEVIKMENGRLAAEARKRGKPW